MENKICLITGGTSGIGKATAIELARMGGTIVLGCRDTDRGETTRREIISLTGNNDIHIICADLSSQRAIAGMSREFAERFSSLHLLINNAGAVFPRRELTEDGIEKTFALNHLAYFLTSKLLLALIKKSTPARIVNVTSLTYKYVHFNPGNLQGEIKFSPALAYAQSKLANILFTRELARRLPNSFDGHSSHPGREPRGLSIWPLILKLKHSRVDTSRTVS